MVDASPLICLAKADALELLDGLCTRVVVPDAVVDEILAGSDDAARRAILAGWGDRLPVDPLPRIDEWGLGRGEGAVLALALERNAIAIVDDRMARRAASALGVQMIGTIGVIVRAKGQGVVPEVAPLIRRVLDAGLYFDEDAIGVLLDRLGKTWTR